MSVQIIYEDVAPLAKADSSVSASEEAFFFNFSHVVELERDKLNIADYALLEQNLWQLNGAKAMLPENDSGVDMGLWSNQLSGEDCSFAVPISLQASFTQLHSGIGVTLRFDTLNSVYATAVNIKYYNGATELHSANYSPNAVEFFCTAKVEGYNKIIISFTSVSLPCVRLRVSDIKYGMVRRFGIDELEGVSLLNETSLISDEVSINTLDFTLRNKSAVPFMFQKKQPLTVMNGSNSMGVFYIDKSKQIGASKYELACIDAVGILDEVGYYGGIYTGQTAATVMADIFAGVNGVTYSLTAELQSTAIYGWLPICTAREALAQLAFAICATVRTTDEGIIELFKLPSFGGVIIPVGRIFSGCSIATAPLVTAVEVTQHVWIANSTSEELFNEVMNGTVTIKFPNPMHDLRISGGIIIENGANYARISGTGVSVVLTGQKYDERKQIVRIDRPNTGAVDKLNVVSVTDATLIGTSNSLAVAQAVYDYYQRRDTLTSKFVLSGERIGDKVILPTDFAGNKTGIISSMTIAAGAKPVAEAAISVEEGAL